MKAVIKLIVYASAIVMPMFSNGQYLYNYHEVIPNQPIITDTIRILDSVGLPTWSTRRVFSESKIIDTLISVHLCYHDYGGGAQPIVRADTTFIHPLPAGIYSVMMYGSLQIGSNDSVCISDIADTIRFSFTVTAPSTIAEFQGARFTISPNPTTDKLYINTSLQDLDFTIADMTGRVYTVPRSRREIDVSSLSAGVYFIRLQDRSGNIVRRFVRE